MEKKLNDKIKFEMEVDDEMYNLIHYVEKNFSISFHELNFSNKWVLITIIKYLLREILNLKKLYKNK